MSFPLAKDLALLATEFMPLLTAYSNTVTLGYDLAIFLNSSRKTGLALLTPSTITIISSLLPEFSISSNTLKMVFSCASVGTMTVTSGFSILAFTGAVIPVFVSMPGNTNGLTEKILTRSLRLAIMAFSRYSPNPPASIACRKISIGARR